LTLRRWSIILFTSVFLALPAWAGKKVVIVRSSALPLYESGAKGFKRCSKADVVGDFTLTDDAVKDDAILSQAKEKGPDLILTLGTTATRTVREKIESVPSVFGMVIDPVANKFSPTGVPMDLKVSVQLDFIRKNFPQLARVGVLYSPGRNKDAVAELKALQGRGEAIVLVEVTSIDKLDDAVNGLAGKADCLLMLTDPVIYTAQTAPQLILQTLQRGLPIIAVSPAYVKAGALMGLYTSPEENGCAAGSVTDRVLGGEKAGSIPFAWMDKYSVAVNMVVAERLKIKVPASVTNSAEQVVK